MVNFTLSQVNKNQHKRKKTIKNIQLGQHVVFFVVAVQLTSHHFVLKVHPPICGITAHATMPGWLELS